MKVITFCGLHSCSIIITLLTHACLLTPVVLIASVSALRTFGVGGALEQSRRL